MNDVRLYHQGADYRGGLGAVSVFEPMDEARYEISQQDDAERLEDGLQSVHAI